MNVDEVLPTLGAILAPEADDDPVVYDSYVDAIDVPAYMLVWAEPWLEEPTVCGVMALPVVTAIAGRLEPGDGLRRLEQMVAGALRKLRAYAAVSFAVGETSGPRRLDVAGTHYLAARIPLRVAVTF